MPHIVNFSVLLGHLKNNYDKHWASYQHYYESFLQVLTIIQTIKLLVLVSKRLDKVYLIDSVWKTLLCNQNKATILCNPVQREWEKELVAPI